MCEGFVPENLLPPRLRYFIAVRAPISVGREPLFKWAGARDTVGGARVLNSNWRRESRCPREASWGYIQGLGSLVVHGAASENVPEIEFQSNRRSVSLVNASTSSGSQPSFFGF